MNGTATRRVDAGCLVNRALSRTAINTKALCAFYRSVSCKAGALQNLLRCKAGALLLTRRRLEPTPSQLLTRCGLEPTPSKRLTRCGLDPDAVKLGLKARHNLAQRQRLGILTCTPCCALKGQHTHFHYAAPSGRHVVRYVRYPTRCIGLGYGGPSALVRTVEIVARLKLTALGRGLRRAKTPKASNMDTPR
jgi:hypothetical protein